MQILRRFSAILVGPILALTSCSVPVDAPTGPVATYTLGAIADTVRAWLPVGTIVPVGTAIAAPPEPYDPAKHGPALVPDTTFENLADFPAYRSFPKRGLRVEGVDCLRRHQGMVIEDFS